MDSPIRIDALVEPLRADVMSGASAVAGMAAEAVCRLVEEAPVTDAAELRRRLIEMATAVLDAQPAMAPLVALMREVLEAAGTNATLEAVRDAAAGAARAFRTRMEACTLRLASHAADLIPPAGRVLTISSSSAVRATLLLAAESRTISVVCLESRPMNEGRALATELAAAGIPLVYAVDAAAHVLANDGHTVLLGADSVGDRGVVNKIGSTSLALSARELGIPVYVLADESKLLPRGFPQHTLDDRPGEEVWPAPAGVRVWNRYFEVIPLELVTAVVTEAGVLGTGQVEALRRTMDLPDELRR